MFGGNRNQPSNEDRPVLIDGRTGRIIETRDDDRDDRPAGRGQGGPDRGSARFIYDEYGNPTPYRPGQEW
jgi:hypothetical protein